MYYAEEAAKELLEELYNTPEDLRQQLIKMYLLTAYEDGTEYGWISFQELDDDDWETVFDDITDNKL